MRFPLLLAGLLACLAAPTAAAECAAIIEVVPVQSASIDFLVIYRAENGNVQMIAEFDGCLIGQPIVIDGPRQEVGA